MTTHSFFKTGKILGQLNTTFISLILKKSEVSSMFDFRPINICNTMYMIFSKLIVNRLKPVLHILIASNQKGFVPRCQIGKCNKLGSLVFKYEIYSNTQMIRNNF